MITIRIPAPSSALLANVLGVIGLVAIVLAVGGLAGVWWAMLTGGVAALSVAVLASTSIAAQQTAETAPATGRSAPVAAVAKSA